MFADRQVSKPALPGAQLSAVRDQTIADNFFGIGGKTGTCGVIGGRCMAQPDTPLLVQILILKSINGFIDMDAFHNNPVYEGQVIFNQFLLCFGQSGVLLNKCSPPSCCQAAIRFYRRTAKGNDLLTHLF